MRIDPNTLLILISGIFMFTCIAYGIHEDTVQKNRIVEMCLTKAHTPEAMTICKDLFKK